MCNPTIGLYRRDLGNGCVEMEVAVGSILHDICCVEHGSNGKFCSGGIDWRDRIVDTGLPCELEWRRAVEDKLHGRVWQQKFCRNPRNRDEHPLVITHHVATTPRRTVVPARPNLFGALQWVPNRMHETETTRQLCANSSKKLLVSDAQFCCSGRFASFDWDNQHAYCA